MKILNRLTKTLWDLSKTLPPCKSVPTHWPERFFGVYGIRGQLFNLPKRVQIPSPAPTFSQQTGQSASNYAALYCLEPYLLLDLALIPPSFSIFPPVCRNHSF